MTSYTARALPVHRGPAAWADILGPGTEPTPLEANINADIAIVGAGFAGLSAARRLSQVDPSLRITLLDAARVAEGAAGRNSGFMIDIPHELSSEDYAGSGDDRALIALNRQAQAFAGAAVKDFSINPAYFDRAGKINGAASAKAVEHNHALAKHLDTLGEPYEMLDAAQMTEITGSRHYRSGLYTGGTVQLQPGGYIRGLANGLRAKGVAIHENTPVKSITRFGPDWTLTTPKAKLTAHKVILTVNGHLESFGIARDRLMQIFLFAVMTPELSTDQLAALGGAPRWGITPSDPMGTTVRRIDAAQGGNRIVTRTCAVLRPDLASKPRDMDRAARVMQSKFDSRFPALKGMKMQYAWAGHLCLSRNGVSVTRQIDHNIWSACVQNGLGTARGTLTGIAAAEAAMGVSSDITDFFAAEIEPPKLPPRPFRDIGANMFLRWREWKARQE